MVESSGTPKRKLIEVSLPLEAINRESAREKSIRHGHPSTLHLWWSRKPLATARAVLFSQLVDDPSSHPDRFPTEELQRKERERLHGIIERLVVWENVRDKKLLAEAHQEILASTDGNPPPILDPFAGGGTIPLEAQRLGLEAHASDLNPVAVLITKALVEIPPKFRDQPPVFPGLSESEFRKWQGAEGLAADVRAYGAWMRDEAEKRIGHLYPKAELPDGTETGVIAWIWARSVICPNPACRIEAPLTTKWWLGKKKGKEAYVVPIVVADPSHPSGKRVTFEVRHDPANAPSADSDGTVRRNGAVCIACSTAVDLKYVRREGKAGRLGQALLAIVAEGSRRRLYLSASAGQPDSIERPEASPEAPIPDKALGFRVQEYGMTSWGDLFTARQLVALTILTDLAIAARDRVLKDALRTGLPQGERLEAGGVGAAAYADAVATYLTMSVTRMVDRHSLLTTWDNGPKKEYERGVFSRHAIQMSWDFVESNPIGGSGAGLTASVSWLASALERATPTRTATVRSADAATRDLDGLLISTDPPYYDNIGYADLSDFFYVWLRRPLQAVHPQLFSTMLVPKAEELVANPYRHDGKAGAKDFFEGGFRQVFARAREAAPSDFPITVYYAFKQTESEDAGTGSSGWETLLDGMIESGWAITSTWPMRSELPNRMLSIGTNALASSIVLSLRPRPADAPTTDRRGLIEALQVELPGALRRLQEGLIAPVDLPQAAIGPGMAVFSRYSSVIEADGSPMTVRSALARINEILDQVLAEQEGDFDSATRFAIAWYRQNGYSTGKFGDADNLARARGTAVDAMDRAGILTSRAGKVTLIRPAETPEDYDVLTDLHVSAWEALHHLIRHLELGGIGAAGAFLATAASRPDGAVEPDLVKELAFLLFSIAEKNGWAKDALSFNAVGTAWAEILDASRAPRESETQTEMEFGEDDDGDF